MRKGDFMTAIYTIGHSVRHLEKFVGILKYSNIDMVVDVRTIPWSRHNPQFNEDVLEKYLPKLGIKYTHMKELGGLRRALSDSINLGWKELKFRGYADYMQTMEFEKGIDKLIDLAKKNNVVIMCSEGSPFNCHRLLVADALVARGIKVLHIAGGSSAKEHTITSFAKVRGHKVTYPRQADQE